MRKLIVLVVLLIITSISIAQTFAEIYKDSEISTHIATGKDVMRVGNGTFVWVLTSKKSDNAKIWYPVKLYLSCDGKYVSEPIYSTITFDFDSSKTTKTELLEAKGEDNQKYVVPASIIEISKETSEAFSWSGLNEKNISALSRRAQSLCNAAAPEERNLLFPIAATQQSQDGSYTIHSALTGTHRKLGAQISVWLDVKPVKKTLKTYPASGRQTEVMEIDRNAGRELQKWTFDCRKRISKIDELIEYDKNGKPNKMTGKSTDPLTDSPPNSVGETITESVCKIFG